MDRARIAFLFGEPPAWADPDDPDDRAQLLSELLDDDDDSEAYELVADHIADDDPPEVWQSAERLLGLGLDREDVMDQLVAALVPLLDDGDTADEQDGEGDGGTDGYDIEAYKAALATLPLPTWGETVAAVLAAVRSSQPVDQDELVTKTSVALGRRARQEPLASFVDEVVDDLIADDTLLYLCDDRLVEPCSFSAGSVLTHRLSEAERSGGYLELGVDLAPFDTAQAKGPGGVELEVEELDVGSAWLGPKGWLEGFATGTVFAARAGSGGTAVLVEVLVTAPEVGTDAVEAVRAACELGTAEAGLPMSALELAMELLAGDPQFFAEPLAPLSELAEAGGLEVRGDELAHAPELWENARRLERASRVTAELDDIENSTAALKVVSLFEERDWGDAERLREALAVLGRDPDLATVVSDELLGHGPLSRGEMAELAVPVARFASRLFEVARKPREVAVARWLAALAAERAGDLLAAEAQLQLAFGTGAAFSPAVDRLAWYLSDKGEAAEAARLWRSLGVSPEEPELAAVERASHLGEAAPGRNEPCWCGSGRKYKWCHFGKPTLTRLADRIDWIVAKAVGYLRRQGSRAWDDTFAVAVARGDGFSGEAMDKAFSDPITLDLVLHEGGWFANFLEERGPLLPEDEALLATSWVLGERSIYEVVSTSPGRGLMLKDLRSAEEVEVREQTFSAEAYPGLLVCARVVPDGAGHQLVGGVFRVAAGTEAALLDLLDQGDPKAIASWVARLERPPDIRNREGEATILCQVVLEVPSESAARQALDRLYEAGEAATWTESFQLSPDERIVRAMLHLEGNQLDFRTNSEERADRVLTALKTAIPRLRVVSDERQGLDELRRSMPPGGLTSAPVVVPPEVREQIQAQLEQRWCDEAVPALAGMTPRQAAANPTRRETLERLLRDFEEMDRNIPEEGIVMRPARLREMLDLP